MVPALPPSFPPNFPWPVIFGCAGETLSAAERQFFRRVKPTGLILFARNCQTPAQVAALVDDFKQVVDAKDPLILIDQEGGRVQRLGPPHWPALPAASRIAGLAGRDAAAGVEAARLLGRLLAADLVPLGITVDCAPVLDILRPETHDIIGDRSFGAEPEQVIRLGDALCQGLLKGGVLPVIKHMPGHGRARVDTHKELPVVDAPLDELKLTDFAPFRALSHMPLAMTAHVVFTAADPAAPVTTSRRAVDRLIRGQIGFGGLLLTDDLGMQALQGDMRIRTRDCQRAGCDLVLHCSGDMAEMEMVAEALSPMQAITAAWLRRAGELRHRSQSKLPFDRDAGFAQLQNLLGGNGESGS